MLALPVVVEAFPLGECPNNVLGELLEDSAKRMLVLRISTTSINCLIWWFMSATMLRRGSNGREDSDVS